MGNKPATKTLWYADDDEEDRSIFVEMMSRINPSAKVQLFENGLELYQTLEREDQLAPCCIVLDFNMPLWDGLRTLRALKEESRYLEIPVCMLTTSENILEQKACEQNGAHAFFTKPSSITEMKNIGEYLTRWCADICGCSDC